MYNRKRFVALWRAVTASLSSGITVVYFSDIIIHVLCDVQMTRRVAPFYRASHLLTGYEKYLQPHLVSSE